MDTLRRLINWVGTLDGESVGRNLIQMLNASLYNSVVEFIKEGTFDLMEFVKRVPQKYIDQVLIKVVSDWEYDLFIKKPKEKREVRSKIAHIEPFTKILEKLEEHKKVDIQKKVDVEPRRRHEMIPIKVNIPLHHSGIFMHHI